MYLFVTPPHYPTSNVSTADSLPIALQSGAIYLVGHAEMTVPFAISICLSSSLCIFHFPGDTAGHSEHRDAHLRFDNTLNTNQISLLIIFPHLSRKLSVRCLHNFWLRCMYRFVFFMLIKNTMYSFNFINNKIGIPM